MSESISPDLSGTVGVTGKFQSNLPSLQLRQMVLNERVLVK